MSHASAQPRGASITSRITGSVLLTISICLLTFAWVMHTQLQWSVQQQANALAQTLLQQTRSATESALSADDTLSVAVLLRELVENPYVSHAALYSVDNRIIAEAGKRPKATRSSGFYSQQLTFQDVVVGSLHLHIDTRKLQEPLTTSLQTMAVLGVILLILAAFIAVHLGRSVARPLQSLSNWLINPAPPAPHIKRGDEIGLLARQLNQYFLQDTQNAQIPILEDTQDIAPVATNLSSKPATALDQVDRNAAENLTPPLLRATPAPTHNAVLAVAPTPPRAFSRAIEEVP